MCTHFIVFYFSLRLRRGAAQAKRHFLVASYFYGRNANEPQLTEINRKRHIEHRQTKGT